MTDSDVPRPPQAGADLPPPTPPTPPAPPEGFASTAKAAWHDLRAALDARARLLTLEVRLAGLTLVQILVFAVMIAVLVVTAWIGLMGAFVLAFVTYGWPWGVALALAIVFNLALAAWLGRSILALLQRIDLKATLNRLQGRPEGEA